MLQERSAGRIDDHIAANYIELFAILAVGAGHVATEILFDETTARLYNVVAAIGILVYVIRRLLLSEGYRRAWGMRVDNFQKAVRAHLAFAVPALVAIVFCGLLFDSLRLPATFWLTVALYPLWGIAQQFALQNLIARNLRPIVGNRLLLALIASALFSLAHLPQLPLVALTLVAGFFFTLIHRRAPNIWAVGIVHGLLGSCAFYVVLGEDPGAAIIAWLSALFV
jgi:membrane protease YdiL (CAAX protease family)